MADHDDLELAHLDDEHGPGDEFGDSREHLGGAGELVAARHFDAREKAQRLRQKYNAESSPTFLSKDWFKSFKPAPLAHIKRNWLTIASTTASAAAIATVGSNLLLDTPDVVAITKTALLAYPGWRLFNDGFAYAGFWLGHLSNGKNRDRLREVKTEPAGRWSGRALYLAAAFLGGTFGHGYFEKAVDVTLQLPSTITQGAGSAFVDTFTYQSNTAWDPIWETEDQAGCLFQQALDPDHGCLPGPGSEGIEVTIDPTIITPQTSDGELSWFGRAWDKTGLDIDIPNPLPEAEDVNRWIIDRMGIGEPPANDDGASLNQFLRTLPQAYHG